MLHKSDRQKNWPSMKETTHIIEAGALHDACGVGFRPGALAIRGGKILAAGLLDDIHRQYKTDQNNGEKQSGKLEIHKDWSNFLILPAMVNAHAHLDLSDLAPAPLQSPTRGLRRRPMSFV